MAPTKRAAQDDTTLTKPTANTSAKAQGKKPAGSNAATATNGTAGSIDGNGKGIATSTATANSNNTGVKAHFGWRSAPVPLLATYRWAQRLPGPMPYSHPLHQALLTNKGVGRHSPTAVARRRRRMLLKAGGVAKEGGDAVPIAAVSGAAAAAAAAGSGLSDAARANAAGAMVAEPKSRDDFAVMVRRQFNASSTDENTVAAELIYKVHHQDQGFRLRSLPKRGVIVAS